MASTSRERAHALETLAATIADLRLDLVENAAQVAVRAGATRMDFVQEAVAAGLRVVGQRFSDGTYFVPQLVLASDIARLALATMPTVESDGDRDGRPCVVLGTVSGDVHDIGKNLVAEILSASGCRVVDLGIDQPPEAITEAALLHRADLIGLSALMTTTFPSMEHTVAVLKDALPRTPVIVGGAPMTAVFAESIGADGYGALATDALYLVERLCATA